MQTYLALGKLSQTGFDGMENGPDTLEEFVGFVNDSLGGKFDADDFYLLNGEIDWAAFMELPDQQAVARLTHAYARTGRGRVDLVPIAARGADGYREYIEAL